MRVLSSYLHNDGLYLGVYSSAGNFTCAGQAGSYGYETLDANDFVSVGVDSLKYGDECSG